MILENKEGQKQELFLYDDTAEFNNKTFDIETFTGNIEDGHYLSVNHLIVKDEAIASVIERFQNRKGNVDQYDGFTGFMLLNYDNEFLVLTGWEDETAFQAWVDSKGYQNSHEKKAQRVKEKGSEYLLEQPQQYQYTITK